MTACSSVLAFVLFAALFAGVLVCVLVSVVVMRFIVRVGRTGIDDLSGQGVEVVGRRTVRTVR